MARKLKVHKRQPTELDDDIFDLITAMANAKTADIARDAGLSYSCVSKIRSFATRFPRYSTVRNAYRALGFRYQLVRHETPRPAKNKPAAAKRTIRSEHASALH